MANHPNRNWRARMRQACAKWLTTWYWRPRWAWAATDDGGSFLSREQVIDVMGQSYRAGYEAGRASMQRGKLANNAPTAQEPKA